MTPRVRARVGSPGSPHITRHLGPPLAHTIPDSLALTSDDITVVRYLQAQGLWGHDINNRDAREVLRLSTFTVQNSRLAHVVKWMKRYGDTPPEVAEHEAEHEVEHGAEHRAEREVEGRNMLVSERNTSRTRKTKRNRVSGT